MRVRSTLAEASVAVGKKPDVRVWVWPAKVQTDGPKLSWPEVIIGVRDHTSAFDPGFLDTKRLNQVLSTATGRTVGVGSAQKKYDGLRPAILSGKDHEDVHEFESKILHALQSAGYTVVRK